MALTAAQYTSMWSTSDTDADYLTSDEISEMTASFTNNDYINDKATLAMLGPVMHQIQKMQDELDYLRGIISNNNDKTGITTAQANAIIANTAKTSMVIGTGANEAMAGNTTIPTVNVTTSAGTLLVQFALTTGKSTTLDIVVTDKSDPSGDVTYTGSVALTQKK